MTWRVAYSLDTLLAEVNAAAPDRSNVSDGSIGDAAHASRSSDHNPWIQKHGVGIVRARDFTHDPAAGLDAHALAEQVRLLGIRGHPALGSGAYVISNGRIASATYGWAWRDYSGSNPHDKHSHVSVTTDPDGFDSDAPWGVTHREDWFDMADKEDLRTVVREELDKVLADFGNRAVVDNPFEKDKSKTWRLNGVLNSLTRRTAK